MAYKPLPYRVVNPRGVELAGDTHDIVTDWGPIPAPFGLVVAYAQLIRLPWWAWSRRRSLAKSIRLFERRQNERMFLAMWAGEPYEIEPYTPNAEPVELPAMAPMRKVRARVR